MDAFVVAFRIPNLLRDLFAEGALSAAFVTVFSEYDQRRTPRETWRLVNNVLTALTVILSVLTLLGIFFSEELVRLLAPDFAAVPGKIALTQRLTVIMFPFLLLISVAALVMGILNTRGHFFVPALASSCFNLGSILGGVGLALLVPRWGHPAIVGMAIGTLIGGGAQLAIQLPLLRKEGFWPRPFLALSDLGLRCIGRLVIPAIVGLSATQINIFVNTNFASRCAEGSVAWLNYAFRLIQFPIGLFGVALSVATLPVVARQAARKEIQLLGGTLVSSLTLAFALTIPAAVGLWILADPIVRLIFEHGRFTAADTLMTAQAVRFYAMGLLAYAAVKIIVPVFYALDDTRWPVLGSFFAVGINVGIVLSTLGPLQHRAIALATSVSMIVNFLLLAMVLYRKIGGYPVGSLIGSILKIVVASGLMGLLVAFLQELFGTGPDAGLARIAMGLGAIIVLAVGFYAVLLSALRVPVVGEILGMMRRR